MPRTLASDALVLQDCKRSITNHLSAAVMECYAHVRGLGELDPDAVMAEVRTYFDPIGDARSQVNDLLDDCLADLMKKASDPLASPVRERDFKDSSRFVRQAAE